MLKLTKMRVKKANLGLLSNMYQKEQGILCSSYEFKNIVDETRFSCYDVNKRCASGCAHATEIRETF